MKNAPVLHFNALSCKNSRLEVRIDWKLMVFARSSPIDISLFSRFKFSSNEDAITYLERLKRWGIAGKSVQAYTESILKNKTLFETFETTLVYMYVDLCS